MRKTLRIVDEGLGGIIVLSKIARLKIRTGYWNKDMPFPQERCERFADVPTGGPSCGSDDNRPRPTKRIGVVSIVYACVGDEDTVLVDAWPTLALAQKRVTAIAKMIEKA